MPKWCLTFSRLNNKKFAKIFVLTLWLLKILESTSMSISWIPEGGITTLQPSCSCWREMWPETLLDNNVPTDSALSVERLLTKYSIPVIDHLSFLPNFARCYFFVGSKIKSSLKWTISSVTVKGKRALKISWQTPATVSNQETFVWSVLRLEDWSIFNVKSKHEWNQNILFFKVGIDI